MRGSYIGNLSAAVACQKLFETGHPTYQEVVEFSKDPDFRYRPEIASDPRLATFWGKSEIEVISPVEKGGYPEIAIFDHDGTISTLRQGWEKCDEIYDD